MEGGGSENLKQRVKLKPTGEGQAARGEASLGPCAFTRRPAYIACVCGSEPRVTCAYACNYVLYALVVLRL